MARWLISTLVVVLVGLMAGVASAQEDIEVSTFLFTADEARTLFAQHPIWSGDGSDIPFELSGVDGAAALEISATSTDVVAVFISVVFRGGVRDCPARVWYSASSEDIRPGGTEDFVVTMTGSWQFNWTTRDAPQDQCRRQFAVSEPLTFALTIAIDGDGPAVTDGGGFPVPASARWVVSTAATPASPEEGSTTEAILAPATPEETSGEGRPFVVTFLVIVIGLVVAGVAVALAFAYAFRRATGGSRTALDETLADAGLSTDDLSLDGEDDDVDALLEATKRLKRRPSR